ncbi:MAG TPA: FAD-binding oxidoreductase, partial [Acidimicrobiales bacterium]|nr:FAD-binding oxidoreductase [Acidimicrobiales bacterium]
MTRQRLSGWGRTAASLASVITPSSEDEVAAALAGPVIARGLGRSYGDAAQLAGGVVLDNSGFDAMSPVSAEGLVTVGAGVSLDDLLALSIPQGWFIPVTPGTRQVSVGGMIGADVHGKNHHRDGSISAHVRAMRIVTPVGTFETSPTQEDALFWATMGAMGLTGVVTSVTFQMIPIETDQVLVDTDRFDDLDAVMAEMSSGDDAYHYSVAWVDCMTRGRHMGRAILSRGEHAPASQVESAHLRAPRAARLVVPVDAPSGLLNPLTIKAFNELWFRSAPRHERHESQSLSTFFHPLDGVRDWNRLYGKRGFVQYQFCVPDESAEAIVEAIRRLSASRVPSFLAVLKRFGAATPAPLSFPQPGWTLALDLPVGPAKLPGMLDELDELVIAAGGRVYLAKDARLAPETFAAMYPQLDDFLAVKARVDPEGHLTSDLARRLHL